MSREKTFKIAILWRGDAEARQAATPQNNRFHRIFEELAAVGIHAEPAVYDEDFAAEVREQLLRADGVLVWVDPIRQGKTRAALDSGAPSANTISPASISSPRFRMPHLNAASYVIEASEQQRVWRPQLVRSTLPCRYEGVLHEASMTSTFLSCRAELDGGRILPHQRSQKRLPGARTRMGKQRCRLTQSRFAPVPTIQANHMVMMYGSPY